MQSVNRQLPSTVKTQSRKLFVLLVCALTLHGSLWPSPASGEKLGRVRAPLLEVVDGDTLRVEIDGSKELVRLIGMDAPESLVTPKLAKDSNQNDVDTKTILELGKRSAKVANELLRGQRTVELEFDVQQRDRYGRILAYVYLPNGDMMNEVMLARGYATTYTSAPNLRYRNRLVAASEEGRVARRGLWSMRGFSELQGDW